jgi:hypothetical protein
MADLGTLTHEQLAACLNQGFTIEGGDGSRIEVALIDVQARGAPIGQGPAGRQPFSAVFRGPREPILPQRIYALGNATLGEIQLFLVPIGPDDEGIRYEAVFN